MNYSAFSFADLENIIRVNCREITSQRDAKIADAHERIRSKTKDEVIYLVKRDSDTAVNDFEKRFARRAISCFAT